MARKSDAAKRRKMIQSLVSASIVDKNGVEVHPLEKLRMAFALMEERGVMAEGRWLCCLSCGQNAMRDLYDEISNSGADEPFGYCFFHDEDWEAYTEENAGEIYLAYNSFLGSAKAVGRIITDCLDALGMEWAWGGSTNDRISVKLGAGTGVLTKWRRSRRLGKVVNS
jgi:hypothetical protein